MKKIIAVILSLIMVMSFAACSPKAETVNFTVVDLEGNTVHDFDVEVKDGDMAGDLLEKGLSDIGVDYEILDETMIQRIGDLEQDSVNWTVYWSVYVNGEYGQLGLWEQPVKSGDAIKIALETFEG